MHIADIAWRGLRRKVITGAKAKGDERTGDRRFRSPTSISTQQGPAVEESSATCQIRNGDQYIIEDAWNLISIVGDDLLGRITFANERLDEHATGSTTPPPNQDGFSNRNRRHNGVVSKGRQLDPVSTFRERSQGETHEKSFANKISKTLER